MVHLRGKKVRRVRDGEEWWTHGRGSTAAKVPKYRPGTKLGYTLLHSAVDGFSWLAYAEILTGETVMTTMGYFCRAKAF